MIRPTASTSATSTHTSPLRVGIVGLGRSGWNIHAKTLASLPEHFVIAAVTDPEPDRCEEAHHAYGCRTYPHFDALIEDRNLELVVVASPNHLHTQHAIDAMAAGHHVVCEKPFALSVDEADRAIQAAESYGRVLSPFQNRRYESHFLKTREVINSGVLGRVIHIRMCWHQFTRRWDWQTLRRYGGGLLNNNGSHLLDHALQLFPEDVEPELFADLQQVLTLGDTEDHVKIVLKAEGCPTIDVELTNASAFPQDRWMVLGDRGGLRGDTDHLQWRTIDWDAHPQRTLETVPTSSVRDYNKDDIHWTQHEWRRPVNEPREYARFYLDLYQTVRHGRPQTITPQSVRRLIATLERCYEQCPQTTA